MRNHIPKILENRVYCLLRDERIDEANGLLAAGEPCDLSGAYLRGFNLRRLDVEGMDFTNSYLRLADLRGLDLRHCCMKGASIHGAKIHGTYFPEGLSAEEIRLSLEHGTRLRYR